MSVKAWYTENKAAYDITEQRLEATKERFLSHRDIAHTMLRDSIFNSLASMQTPVARHERAYVEYKQGNVSALMKTNYGPTKLQRFNAIDGDALYNIVDYLYDGKVFAARDELIKIKGLAVMKASFTLAMLGFTEVMCLDTNVQQLCDINARTRSVTKYDALCRDVHGRYKHLELSPFMTQWCLFDYNRGIHSDHKVWFDSHNTYHVD